MTNEKILERIWLVEQRHGFTSRISTVPIENAVEYVRVDLAVPVNAIAYEFMKLFGATTKNGWTHDQMQPMFDATREIITRTFPVLVELDTAAATAAPVEQSDLDQIRARAYNSIQFSADVYMHDVRHLLRLFAPDANEEAR